MFDSYAFSKKADFQVLFKLLGFPRSKIELRENLGYVFSKFELRENLGEAFPKFELREYLA